MEIGNILEKKFRIMIAKIIQDLRKRMETQTKKLQEKINKELEDLKEKQTWVHQKKKSYTSGSQKSIFPQINNTQ